MSVFGNAAFAEHDRVVFCRDRRAGLRAIIAIHDRTLGPAVGGCRMWNYESEDAALTDVLRLSRGMSFKNAMAGLPLGGGKAVILGDPKTDKTPELMRAFGRCVNDLNGNYITAEDVGMTVADMAEAAKETKWVAGLAEGGAASGDPSPVTAYGVYVGIKASLAHRFGDPSPAGRTIAVQGLGNVGRHLCDRLHAAGAKLIVADIDQSRVAEAVEKYGAEAVAVDAIHMQKADVFAPCALGAILNEATIPVLGAPIVAGAANNQLKDAAAGRLLMERGILYAPDYVINAGGIINASYEVLGHYDRDAAFAKTAKIEQTLTDIYRRAEREKRPMSEIADAMAMEIIDAKREHSKAA